jgi:hypothetical protein
MAWPLAICDRWLPTSIFMHVEFVSSHSGQNVGCSSHIQQLVCSPPFILGVAQHILYCHTLLLTNLQVALGEQPCSNDGHTWRLMHGDDDQPLTSRMLTTVHEVLQESFDPIISDVSVLNSLHLKHPCSQRDGHSPLPCPKDVQSSRRKGHHAALICWHSPWDPGPCLSCMIQRQQCTCCVTCPADRPHGPAAQHRCV